MRLYHFTHAKHALEDIYKRRLKIAQFSDLNDPFELMCVDVSGYEHELAFNLYKPKVAEKFGILCFSEKWKSILQWSHYAERHKGISLGFDVTNSETKFGRVDYKSGKLAFPGIENLNQAFMWKMLRTKYRGWDYEQEWRVFINLETPEWNESEKRDLYFAEFGDELILKEVILGVANENNAEEIHHALSGYSNPVQVSKIHLCPSGFRLQRHDV
jgi:hypothetical protein